MNAVDVLRRIRSRRRAGRALLAVGIAAIFAAATSYGAEEADPLAKGIVPLKPAEEKSAIRQLAKAESMRRSWETLLIEERMSPPGRNTRDDIAGMYAEVVREYPKSVYAAQSLSTMMSMYSSTLDMTKVINVYQKLTKVFPSTRYALDAHMHVGLTYLERLKHPDKARKYFERVPNPRKKAAKEQADSEKTEPEELTEAESYYVNARLHLIKSLYAGGETEQAEREIGSLKEGYPEAVDRVQATVVAIEEDTEDTDKERRGVRKLLRIIRQR